MKTKIAITILLFVCASEAQWKHKKKTKAAPPKTKAPTTKLPTTKPKLVCPENDKSCVS